MYYHLRVICNDRSESLGDQNHHDISAWYGLLVRKIGNRVIDRDGVGDGVPLTCVQKKHEEADKK